MNLILQYTDALLFTCFIISYIFYIILRCISHVWVSPQPVYVIKSLYKHSESDDEAELSEVAEGRVRTVLLLFLSCHAETMKLVLMDLSRSLCAVRV